MSKKEIKDRHYIKHLKEIREAYEESKDWDKVINSVVYTDIDEAQEAFIDYVEEVYKTKVKDAKHLQELTGCAEYKETEKIKLKDVINTARFSKYSRALETALEGGATYPELLKIKPKEYGLPKTWSGCLGSDQYSTILWALSFEFLINEPASLMLLPDLRSIAEEIKAPYSVLMDCYNLTNKGKKYGATGD